MSNVAVICANCTYSTGEGTILFCSFHGGKAIYATDKCGSFLEKVVVTPVDKITEAVWEVTGDPVVEKPTVSSKRKNILDKRLSDS